jgi:hypothetical protein
LRHLETLRDASFAMLVAAAVSATSAGAQVPAPIAAPGEVEIVLINAQGAQIYECKADTAGRLVWQFREPVAALFEDGKTIGRHYAGPTWELDDGSRITGKVAGRAPGASPSDIPLLKLEVATRGTDGRLKDATTVQRLNTKGGVAEGPCDRAGALLSIPYSADYAFLRRAG